ncbi:MAG: twin-arginine translocation signal domain-containing protein [Alphaproteobacteria bacterium]|nr:twin-arginine translocation signal domain-containing protein [Alphaproteobacteria bacterium]
MRHFLGRCGSACGALAFFLKSSLQMSPCLRLPLCWHS